MKKLLTILVVLSLLSSCSDDPIDAAPCGAGRNRCNPDDIVAVRCNDCSIISGADMSLCDANGGFREYICDN